MSPSNESEWLTRKRRIDPRLEAVGWTLRAFAPGMSFAGAAPLAVTEFETASGPAGVLTQAERYARGVAGSPFDLRGLRVRFLYSTNGEVIRFHDVRDRHNLSRTVKTRPPPCAS